MRQIILDTETTGLEISQGHRIIEVGAMEMIDRRLSGNTFHEYLNPQREIDEAAIEIHGVTNEQLTDKPLFKDIAAALIAFIKDAELVIHNAPFDVGFLNHEFKRCGYSQDVIYDYCTVLDTLAMARYKHPGQRVTLNALCRRYGVDNTQRTLHGALLDAELLSGVYLQMTGGQTELLGNSQDLSNPTASRGGEKIALEMAAKIPVINANSTEIEQHEKWLELLRGSTPNGVVWDQIEP